MIQHASNSKFDFEIDICFSQKVIERDITPRLKELAGKFPAIVLTGPRQSGKSTLCRSTFTKLSYTTLESPDVRAFAIEDPRGFLAQYPKGAILDEIQNAPELASYLQEIIDKDPAPGRWILTGSHNLSVRESTNQSLAGRAGILHLLPLTRAEVSRFPKHPATLDETLFTGGYPRILDQKIKPSDWLSSYVATYLERDVRNISNIGDLVTFQRFIQLCAGRTAQLLNLSSLATDCGISQPTAKAWLSVLEASFICFRLPSYHGNVSKRLIKMPKLHFYDSGLVCWLLGIRDVQQLATHPLRGAIFESWVVSEIIKSRFNRGESNGVYFYRDKSGVEADALISNMRGWSVVEIKSGQTVSSPLAANAERIARLLAGTKMKAVPLVIHGGTDHQTRKGVSYIPWDRVNESE